MTSFRPFAAALALWAGPAFADGYLFPLHWEDLQPGERWTTSTHAPGIQRRGNDLGLWQYQGSGEWTDKVVGIMADPLTTNDNSLVYGRPFYAIADGEVIGCWRNAPENDAGTEHPLRAQGLIVGGGNHLWVRQDDGVIVLYAHAIPDTIPPELCPRETAVPGTPFVGAGGSPDVDPQVYVPDGVPPTVATGAMQGGVLVERPRVSRGQQLGLVGNSGSSSGPHLHIHGERVDAGFNSLGPAHLVWERGLFRHVMPGGTDLDFWVTFGDNTLPKGRILIWPPIPQGPQYTRHGMPLEEFPRMRTLLEESGYTPVALDCYNVGGEVFVNMSWRFDPGGPEWRAELGFNERQYQRLMDWATAGETAADRWRPRLVESCIGTNGAPVYGAVFLKGDPDQEWVARHLLDETAYVDLFEDLSDDGWRPVSVAVVSIDNRRRFTVLFNRDDVGPWRAFHRLVRFGSRDQYQEQFDLADADGLTPIYLNAYMHNGRQTFSAIFADLPDSPYGGSHDLSADAFQQAFEDAAAAGLPVRALTAFDGAQQQHVFGAVFGE